MEMNPREPVPIECIEVPNPAAMMGDQPTNAYLVGSKELLIVDPGSEAGVDLVSRAVASRAAARVRAIVLTHGHPDHVAAAGELRRRFGCPIMLHPEEQPILRGFLRWEEVDVELHDGMRIDLPEGTLEVIETPGHSPGHVALWEPVGRSLLAGDLFSGNGTVAIIPPHGSMRAYLQSLHRARSLAPRRILPGHGPEITDPERVIGEYIARRLQREAQIREALASGPMTIDELVTELYPDILPQFRRAGAATVLAHLEKLRDQGEVEPDGEEIWHATWRRVNTTV